MCTHIYTHTHNASSTHRIRMYAKPLGLKFYIRVCAIIYIDVCIYIYVYVFYVYIQYVYVNKSDLDTKLVPPQNSSD